MNRGEIELSPIKAVVDEERCDGCGECVPHCPVEAISVDGVARVNPATCKGCGACIASCPREALDLKLFSNAEIMAEIEAALAGKKPGERRILVFADDMCTYTLADGVGTAKLPYPVEACIIRVPSSSRVTPAMLVRAFALGADAVFLGECEEAVSPYPGTLAAIRENVRRAREALEAAGIEPERIQYSAFVTVMFKKFTGLLRSLAEAVKRYGEIPEEKRKALEGAVEVPG